MKASKEEIIKLVIRVSDLYCSEKVHPEVKDWFLKHTIELQHNINEAIVIVAPELTIKEFNDEHINPSDLLL